MAQFVFMQNVFVVMSAPQSMGIRCPLTCNSVSLQTPRSFATWASTVARPFVPDTRSSKLAVRLSPRIFSSNGAETGSLTSVTGPTISVTTFDRLTCSEANPKASEFMVSQYEPANVAIPIRTKTPTAFSTRTFTSAGLNRRLCSRHRMPTRQFLEFDSEDSLHYPQRTRIRHR